MKPGRVSIAGASLWLLAIQLAVVSSIAAKYFYQRWSCPRAWTLSTAYDPESVLRGRYLSVQVTVDGCQSTLPSAEQAGMARDLNEVLHPWRAGCALPGATQGAGREADRDPGS